MGAPELVRAVAVDRLPAEFVVTASAAECSRVAERLGIISVESLRCAFSLRRLGSAVTAEGMLAAEVTQSCVVSLEPVAQQVAERFTVRFIPEGGGLSEDADPEAPDDIPYAGSTIDLGEAAAEQLALALDPYPRLPDAALDPAAVEPDAGGFGALVRLRPPPG